MRKLLGLFLLGVGISIILFGGLEGFFVLGLFGLLMAFILSIPLILVASILLGLSIKETIKWVIIIVTVTPIILYLLLTIIVNVQSLLNLPVRGI